MRRFINGILLCFTLVLMAGVLPAQTAGLDKCQVLFVVDTSRSMTRYSGMTRQTVFDLVYDGVQGQMNTGDLYGIWTFNEKVQTNAFAPLNWDAQLNRGLAAGAGNFVKALRNDNSTRLDRLWAELAGYARQTKKLTVIILTDGTDRFVGTPFDAQINEYFEKHHREFRQAKKPFVITLAVLDGKFLACTVNGARDAIDFNSIAARVYEWKKGQPQYQLKESQPLPVASNETAAAPPIIAPSTTALAPVTREIAGLAKSESAVPVAAKTNGAPSVAVSAPVATQPPPPVPKVTGSEAVKKEAPQPAIQTNLTPASVPVQPSAIMAVEKTIPASKSQNASIETPTNTSTALASAAKKEAAPVLGKEKQSSQPLEVAAQPNEQGMSRQPSSETSVVGEKKVSIIATNRAGDNSKTTPAVNGPKPILAAPQGGHNAWVFIGCAIVLFLAAICLILAMLRRLRRRPVASFISQSIERESRH